MKMIKSFEHKNSKNFLINCFIFVGLFVFGVLHFTMFIGLPESSFIEAEVLSVEAGHPADGRIEKAEIKSAFNFFTLFDVLFCRQIFYFSV